MRIVIDLQACQSSGSRNRGIGRYALSLTKALLRQQGSHEIFIALNGAFPESIKAIRQSFKGLIPQSHIVVWPSLDDVHAENPANDWRRYSAELLRESFLSNLKPDVVLISSLFEGLGEDIVTSVGCMPVRYKTAVILYDLIPFISRRPYLTNPKVETWYLDKVAHLRRSDLLLSISASSRQEAIDHLAFDPEHVINISSDADACFKKLDLSEGERSSLRSRYGLTRPFVMYTGGIDHRKNIEGLIRSFSRLPETVRASYQLAIVCAVSHEKRRELLDLAGSCGLKHNDIVMTGFVPESDLVALYNLCALFVFPSLHEGFGLPALEAMRCGAPVISSNTSSLPEVIGNNAALFDPHSEEAITASLAKALTDPAFRSALIEQGAIQASRFSWDESARQAIAAMTKVARSNPATSHVPTHKKRPKLAYVSPLPPERSGIADYSAELLPALIAHYDIEVIVDQATVTSHWIGQHCPIRGIDWFIENAHSYDRIIYHFGNSAFHQHMFDLLSAYPGVIVLHDFFLSGVSAHMETLNVAPGFWSRELLRSHGYKALSERFHALHAEDVAWKYPCSLSVIQNSRGVIVHSSAAKSLAQKWYDIQTDDWEIIPLIRNSGARSDKQSARRNLGFAKDDFLVCSFGMLGPSKLNHRLLDTWLDSDLASDPRCYLIFVGENFQGDYGLQLEKRIQLSKSGERIRITGWVDPATFRNYLDAADVGVQLRGLSRGETSATVLDCMNHGLATIANANGSMAELDKEALCIIPDEFTDNILAEALNSLWRDIDLRESYGHRGRELILRDHNPSFCAQKYASAIETFYGCGAIGTNEVITAIGKLAENKAKNADLVRLADLIDRNFPLNNKPKQLLLDLTFFLDDSDHLLIDSTGTLEKLLRTLLVSPPPGYRVDLIYTRNNSPYLYARKAALKLLNCPSQTFSDERVQYQTGDIVVQVQTERMTMRQNQLVDELMAYGIRMIAFEGQLEKLLEQAADLSKIVPELSIDEATANAH